MPIQHKSERHSRRYSETCGATASSVADNAPFGRPTVRAPKLAASCSSLTRLPRCPRPRRTCRPRSSRPLFDDPLDLGALVSRNDDETVVLGVNALVVHDGQGDHAAAPLPSALAENFDQLVGSAACLLVGMRDLAVDRAKHRLVLGDALVSLIHAADLTQVSSPRRPIRLGRTDRSSQDAAEDPSGRSRFGSIALNRWQAVAESSPRPAMLGAIRPDARRQRRGEQRLLRPSIHRDGLPTYASRCCGRFAESNFERMTIAVAAPSRWPNHRSTEIGIDVPARRSSRCPVVVTVDYSGSIRLLGAELRPVRS